MKNEHTEKTIQLALLVVVFILTLLSMVKTCNSLEEQPQPTTTSDTVMVKVPI